MNYECNAEFLKQVTDPLAGWLYSLTAIRTLDLLDWQVANGVRGGLFEIGVYQGKYFSVLLRSGNAAGENIVGVDTFQFAPLPQVMDLLGKNGVDTSRVRMIERPSTKVAASEVTGLLGGKARFISIDGSHLKPDALNDLRLSDELLSDQGIIAADDVLNCLCMGVTEAVCEFLPTMKSRLVPFGYLPNKLLFCRPAMRETYTRVLEDALLAHPHDQIGENFKNNHQRDRRSVITEFVGSPVLVAS